MPASIATTPTRSVAIRNHHPSRVGGLRLVVRAVNPMSVRAPRTAAAGDDDISTRDPRRAPFPPSIFNPARGGGR